jgi:acylphosphatase
VPELIAGVAVKRVHVVVTGRVQGVFFRVETERRARTAGLAGFVRNTPDGDVEAVFEGPGPEVDALVDWCRDGPALAVVEHVAVKEEEPRGDADFVISR